jgi:hypothetical protein
MVPEHLCWIALTLVMGASGVAAQTVADSTLSAVASDSAGSRTADTAFIDSAASHATPAARPALVVEVPPPVDTVVARACRSAAPGAAAPGLLAVAFRAHASESDRAAAAREVGGTLAKAGDGEEAYMRLPEDEEPVRIAASRLIRLSSVSGVSEIPCPR